MCCGDAFCYRLWGGEEQATGGGGGGGGCGGRFQATRLSRFSEGGMKDAPPPRKQTGREDLVQLEKRQLNASFIIAITTIITHGAEWRITSTNCTRR